MSELNEIIHQPLRLKIMAALHAEPDDGPLDFARLKKLTGATDGNLGRHINTLAEAGYLRVEKDFYKNRPRTRAFVTPKGKANFEAHVTYLKTLLWEE